VRDWPVLLVPLKPGTALLPNVLIAASPKTKVDGGKDGVLNCETDYQSYGETVTVVPDVRASTVGIGDGGAGRAGEVVWLERMGVGG
tara:strand:+ start:24313 stop:24573 length:261 start_codon:yes stop_codon:yes gene_type:complete